MAPGATRQEGSETDSRDRVGAGFRKVGRDWIGEGKEKGGGQGLVRLFQEEMLPLHIWGQPWAPSALSAPLTAAPPPAEHSGYSGAWPQTWPLLGPCLIKLPDVKCDRSREEDSEWK